MEICEYWVVLSLIGQRAFWYFVLFQVEVRLKKSDLSVWAEWFTEDLDISSRPAAKTSVSTPYVIQYSGSVFCPTLAHTFSTAYVCLHYAAFLCVRLRVWSIWLPVFPQLGSLTLSSVCSCITGLLFPRLHRPLMITEIQYSPNPHTHGIRSGIIQWQQALGFTCTIS